MAPHESTLSRLKRTTGMVPAVAITLPDAPRKKIVSVIACAITLLFVRSFTYTLRQVNGISRLENEGILDQDVPILEDTQASTRDESKTASLQPRNSTEPALLSRQERAQRNVLNLRKRSQSKISNKIPVQRVIRHEKPIYMIANSASSTSPTPRKQIPIIIISSLRAEYLDQVLEAIHPSHQNPNTPDWILRSPRIVLTHKSNTTDYGDRWNNTLQVAKRHQSDIHVFEGLITSHNPPRDPIRAYYAKMTWYRMMDYVFHTLEETEVLVLEDDAVLSHDGLLVAAALFEEKWRRDDVHSIALGGPSGRNKVNATPNAIMAVRPNYFTAMAYSLNVTVFDEIWDQFAYHQTVVLANATSHTLERTENNVAYADWTMEITIQNFLWDLIQLQPSVGRMHHIGVYGMGNDGNGRLRNESPVPWNFCNSTILDDSRTLNDIVIAPEEVADRDGFVCDDLSMVEPQCLGMAEFLWDYFGPNLMEELNSTARAMRTKELMAQRRAAAKERHEKLEAMKKEREAQGIRLGTKPKRKVPLLPRKQLQQRQTNVVVVKGKKGM